MSLTENLNMSVWQARAANDKEHQGNLSCFNGRSSIAIFGPAGKVFSTNLSIASLASARMTLLNFAKAGNPAKRTVDIRGPYDRENRTYPTIGSMTVGIDEKSNPYIGITSQQGAWKFVIYPSQPNFADGDDVPPAEKLTSTIVGFFEQIIGKLKVLEALSNTKRGKGGSNRQGGGYNRQNNGGYNGGQQKNYGNSGGNYSGGGSSNNTATEALDDEIPF